MSENNPFAALVARQSAQATAVAEPPAVAASPPPGDSPFDALKQPPPFAPAPAVHPSVLNPAEPPLVFPPAAPESPASTEVLPEANADVSSDTPDVVDSPAEEPKPKRRPGRPRKPKPEGEAEDPASELPAAALAVSLPADKAWVELSKRVERDKSKQEDAGATLVRLQDHAADNRANILRVEHEISELTETLGRLKGQQESLESDTASAAAELKSVELRITEANIALTKVRNYILALTDNQSGLIGEVRVTVSGDNAVIEPA